MEDKKIIIELSGKVVKSFYDKGSNKMTLAIPITEKIAQKIEHIMERNSLEYQGENCPLKQMDDGTLIFQASSRFTPEITGIDEDDYNLIGIDSEVTLYTTLKSGRAMRKKYVAAYITGIHVSKFIEFTRNSVFDSDNVIKLDDTTESSDTI